MTTSSHQATRVCALMLHLGYSGYVALDGFGVAAFRTASPIGPAECRVKVLLRLVCRMVRLHRPVRVVLGVPPRDDAETRALRSLAFGALRKLGVEPVSRALVSVLASLGFTRGRQGPGRLARHLVTHFVPTLSQRLNMSLVRLWYRRSAWHALALALYELVQVAPFSAAALTPPSAHQLPAFKRTLAEALPAL